MDKDKVNAKWGALKTGFARTRHKLMVKVGNTEQSVNSTYEEERDRMLAMFKVMKRIDKNMGLYLNALRAYYYEQSEMIHDLRELYEAAPSAATVVQYEEKLSEIDKQRLLMEEHVRKYFIAPLTEYLTQRKDMKARIKELGVRKLDMDRYFREYSKMMENPKTDRAKLTVVETKYNLTKDGYNNLCDEMMSDMPKLYNDRTVLFDLLTGAYIRATAAFYKNALNLSSGILSVPAGTQALHVVQSIPIVQSYSVAEEQPVSLTKVVPTSQPPNKPVPSPTPAVTTSSSFGSNPFDTANIAVQPTPAVIPVTQSAVGSTNPFDAPVTASTPPPSKPTPVPAQSAPAVPMAQVMYTFNAEEEGELSLKKGDIVKVLAMEGQWWEAELNGVKGLVPSNYVKLL